MPVPPSTVTVTRSGRVVVMFDKDGETVMFGVTQQAVVLVPVSTTGKVNEPPLRETHNLPEKVPTCPSGVKETVIEQLRWLVSVPTQLSDSVKT